MFVLDVILNENATMSFINLVSIMSNMTKKIEITFRRNGMLPLSAIFKRYAPTK